MVASMLTALAMVVVRILSMTASAKLMAVI